MKWKALILGGGGSTGEFQMGVLQVLASHYDNFDMYVGVGVGSLHCSVLAQHRNLQHGVKVLQNFWNSIQKTTDLFDRSLLGSEIGTLVALASDKGWARDAAYGNKKLKHLIQSQLDWNDLQEKNNWAIKIASLSDGQSYVISNHQQLLSASNNLDHRLYFSMDETDPAYVGTNLIDIVTASASVPLMLPPVDILGHRFVEGGLREFTPLELAVQAFELEEEGKYDSAEFVVIDNYRREIDFEGPELLDSGSEIVLRSIKIMTVEMAQNDMTAGLERLKLIDDVASSVILVQPKVDFRLHPMDFDNHTLRSQLRTHGTSRAEAIFGSPKHLLKEAVEGTNERLSAASAERVVSLALQDVQGANDVFEHYYGAKVNPIRYHKSNRDDLYSPTSLTELKQIMAATKLNGQKIKTIGSGYAFSNILETDGVRISLEQINNIWLPERQLLKGTVDAKKLLQFEAGATFEDLNRWLWPRGKTVLNQPGFEKLNFFGTATTGGHGSGIRIGPISAAIRSLDILNFAPDGALCHRRIEPTDGITDPEAFRLAHPHIELIQDDEIFYACTVSVGTLGVVYSLIIETQDRFYLEERRSLIKWETLRLNLWEKLNDEAIHSIHIWFNPYEVNDAIYCVLSEYRYTTETPRGKRPWGTSWHGVDEASRVVHWIMEKLPKAIPSFIHAALNQTVSDHPIVLPNPEALNFGSPNHVKVHASNCGIPAKYAIEAADALFDLFQSRYEDELYVTSPIGFRFTSPGNAILSPQYKNYTCMIELPLLVGTDGAFDTIDAFHALLFEKFEGRPHWGQVNRLMTKEHLKRMFPAWRSFVRVYQAFNHGDFDNEFTEQLGLHALITELNN